MTSITSDISVDQVRVTRLENAELIVDVSPETGGRITRLWHKGLAREVLWRNPDVPLVPVAPGSPYDPPPPARPTIRTSPAASTTSCRAIFPRLSTDCQAPTTVSGDPAA